jgi:hypothetical protein
MILSHPLQTWRDWALVHQPLRRPSRIISGGQTGADRGGLDAAIELGIEHAGWCPRDRTAEDGEVPMHYQLREHVLTGYPARTEQNVIDSDASLIFTVGPMTRGSGLTLRFCFKHKRDVKHLDIRELTDEEAALEIRLWLLDCASYTKPVRTLNVAGSRESRSPGIQLRVQSILLLALS